MEEEIKEIKELKSIIESSKILPKSRKSSIKLKFLDETIKEEFPVNIAYNDSHKFSMIIDQFYEAYPEFAEKGIKIFSINGKKIKINELFKNIELDESSIIFIEY